MANETEQAPNTRNTPPTLYEWAGGLPALERMTDLFYSRVPKDAILAPVFARMPKEHSHHVAAFVAEVFGGPKAYTEGFGGSHAGMVGKHLGRHLTEEQRRRWINLMQDCADEIGLPSDPEFRSAFVAYLEWGTRLAVINSQEETLTMETSAPMPQWSWGVVGGPYTPD
jgi:hemoglobin